MRLEHAASKSGAHIKSTNPHSDDQSVSCNQLPVHSRSSILCVAAAAGAFLAVLLIVNHNLFTVPILEYSDYAANAIQIERAKHFRELLGNYSRFSFHHPGPGWFYVFALGEWIFHDLLRWVPSEMNSHILTIILLNTAFLFGTIALLAKQCRSRLFTPAAILVALFFIYVVNRTIPGSAVFSVWMPHVLMFCFLFFVTICATVAMGAVSKLPLLVFSGLMLIHGHAAQPIFVVPLAALACGTVWWRQGRPIGLPRFLVENRKPMALSAALLVGFSVPILLDAVLHRPSNIQEILGYTLRSRGIHNNPMLSLKYEASFLAFEASPEIILQQKSAQLISKGGSKPYVVLYWCLAWLMIGLVGRIYVEQRQLFSPFFRYIAVEIAVVLLLFYCWTIKMAGPLFNFNGYFVYCMQLLTLLVMLALILDGLNITVRSSVASALCVFLPMCMFAATPSFSNAETGDPETNRLIAAVPPTVGPVHFTFAVEDWLTIVGVASRMKHEHRPFCVDDVWGFTFGQDNLCHSLSGLTNLVLTHSARKCESPCRVLSKDEQFEFQLNPYPWHKLPFSIEPDDIVSLNKGFYGSEEGGVWSSPNSTVWSSQESALHFLMDHDPGNGPRVRVRIFGEAHPGWQAHVTLNGHPLGIIVAGHPISEFVVERQALLPGGENELTIKMNNLYGVTHSQRRLGFSWSRVQFETVQP